MEVTLSLPKHPFMTSSVEQVTAKIKLYAALGMYQTGELSIGAACELAGLDRYEFLDELKRRNITLQTQTPDELKNEYIHLQDVNLLNHVATEIPLNALSNQHILTLTQLEMEPEQQTRLSNLLAQNRENQLTNKEAKQLDSLMQKYRQGLKQKAEALKIAVERGLVSSLN